jgi:hypothetical protein
MGWNRSFWFFFAASMIVAFRADFAPRHTMRYDYSAIESRTILLAILWGAIVVTAILLFRKRALWLLVGALIALYWPVRLLVNKYPSCWYLGNCV